ncbi:M20 family metallopeptidase [Pseudorhodoferax soli]|uniref:Acetylornithine deacetylase/succinyl-diaminopimelate desuccinylase-like protein n=1 Tax=Pseudorhodoferax soli TaxID=545864 RepID=A0A368XFG1_9BURK|nr:M20 family metallopeptidase [Pseudorhodoferax soli]RCW66712.1 acetylornithine deacetylase/succinyl-diaminopimelate desuccinylase-like protein [Pseudorhodoferax soli]
MRREQAIAAAAAYFDEGHFFDTLARRVAQRTESQNPAGAPVLRAYLAEDITPELQAMGFACRILDNPVAGGGPFLIAERTEPGASFGVLSYGHADVVRGQDAQWRAGLAPWRVTVEGDRWYGRGSADNKGQHTINLAALALVLQARGGRLGYDLKLVIETGEEIGSPGLRAFCALHREALAADLFIASDGPRVAAARPTLFLGSRGFFNFRLRVRLRPGGHHSGNWGGLLRNAGTRLAHALASLVDAKGRVLVRSLLPDQLPANVRQALATIEVGGGPADPAIDSDWGEPGLTPTERVYGWNTLEVLAFKTGNPDAPVGAIPGEAFALCQIRFVVGTDSAHFIEHLRAHLDQLGFDDVAVEPDGEAMAATRLDPDDPWAHWALDSMRRSSGKAPALLPNFGGSLPNDVFAELLGLPTLWVPHSYPACSQHAPDEHLLGSVAREGLQIMAGLFWDLAEQGPAIAQRRRTAAGVAP